MAKFLIASLLCACLLLEGTKAAQKNLGETCVDGTDTCADNGECVGGKCWLVVDTAGNACTAENTICDPTSLTCQNDKCKLKVDQSCTGKTDKCLANAECKGAQGSEKCTCQDGYKASEDKTKCGAMGIASSILLVVAAFVTSRFF